MVVAILSFTCGNYLAAQENKGELPLPLLNIFKENDVVVNIEKGPTTSRLFSASLFDSPTTIPRELLETVVASQDVDRINSESGVRRLVVILEYSQNTSFFTEYHAQLLKFKKRRLDRQADVAIERVRSPAPDSFQFLRERFSCTSPQFLTGLQYLTFRFLGDDSDKIWSCFPLVKSIREVPSSFRNEGVVKTSLALDDMFTFSGKNEACTTMQLTDDTMLVPISLENEEVTGHENGCFTRGLVSFKSRWSFQEKTASLHPGWQSLSTIFMERPVITVKCFIGDPTSHRGMETLVIDGINLVPYYKRTLLKNGEDSGFIMSSYNFSKGRNPVISSTTGFDTKKGEVTVLSVESIKNCPLNEETKARFAHLVPSSCS